ncbi:MAG: MBL fold metallo-hydrolase [Sedimentisphaerales bacterium]|nr:MBL fold metallo-hydrolase [Sedimentisphaerales bacterium]
MNRIAQYTLVSVVVGFASVGLAQQRDSAPVEFQRISERLFQTAGGRGAQGGVYIGDDGVLVIDAKMDEASVKQVIEGIGKLTDKPIEYLVNTHSDGDHIAGNRYFPKTVTFIAHENCRKEFFLPGRDGRPSQWSTPELAPFVPSVTFADKMVVYLGSKPVEFWYFGVGHTTGDIVVYFPEEKTAFIGDQIFLTRPQLIHSYKGGNSFEHVKTLSKMLATLDAEKFCSGHSASTDRKGIADHIAEMKQLQAKVKSLTEQDKTLADVQAEFDQGQARLIESIYNELKAGSAQ